ncbi:hypothetical protein BC829DRAFT_442854 [Chytridium lagenaria]|nr:hypothetical protein BC829DRAFT_442854 [Chytridium lagenaria]
MLALCNGAGLLSKVCDGGAPKPNVEDGVTRVRLNLTMPATKTTTTTTGGAAQTLTQGGKARSMGVGGGKGWGWFWGWDGGMEMNLTATKDYLWNLLRTSPVPGDEDLKHVTESMRALETSSSDPSYRHMHNSVFILPPPTSEPPTLESLRTLSATLRTLETSFFNVLPAETLEAMKPQIPSDLRHEGEILFVALGLKKAVLVTLPPCTIPWSLFERSCSASSSGVAFLKHATAAGWLSGENVSLGDLYAAMVLQPCFHLFWQDHRSPSFEASSSTPSSTSSSSASSSLVSSGRTSPATDPSTNSAPHHAGTRLTFRKVTAEVTSPTTETFQGSWVLWNPLHIPSDRAVSRIFFRHDAWHNRATNPLPSPPLDPMHPPTFTTPTWSVTEGDLAHLLDYPGTLPPLDASTPSTSSAPSIEDFCEVAYLDRRKHIISPPPTRVAQPTTRGGRRGRGGSSRGSRRGRSTTPRYVAGSTIEPSHTLTRTLGSPRSVDVTTSSSSLSTSEDDTFFEGDDEDEFEEEEEEDEESGEEELVLVTTFGAVRSEMDKVFEHFREYRRVCKGVMDLAIWTSLE